MLALQSDTIAPGIRGGSAPRGQLKPIADDLSTEKGLKLGGVFYYGEEFLQRKVAFMRTPRVLEKDDDRAAGLGLESIKTWADVTANVPEIQWGHCWIDERVEDYLGNRGPVWQRIAANDVQWVLFRQAQEHGLKQPSFKMIEAILKDCSGDDDEEQASPEEMAQNKEILVRALALAESLQGDHRSANYDAEIIRIASRVVEQIRGEGESAEPDDVIETVKTIWTNPRLKQMREKTRR